MECTHCWGPHGFWILPAIFMVLMIICWVRAVRRAGYRTGGRGYRASRGPGWCCGRGWDSRAARRGETPERILERRYARGEIDREEYERMKRDVSSES